MIQNYLKIAFRNLLKHRLFSIVNILGLSVGMTACLLILQYVRYEWNYDKISPNTPTLWRAFNETVTNGQVTTQDGNTHSILAPSLKADLPEVTDYFRLYNSNRNEIVFYQNNEPEKVEHPWMTDAGFLRLFPQRFLEGDAKTCLLEPWKMVLTKSVANRLFPNESAMGKTLHVPEGAFSGDYIVEGIVADPPKNTHLKFNVLASYATRYTKGHEDNWEGYWDYTYFQIAPNAEGKVRQKLAEYSETHLKTEGIRLAMQPFESIHLHSNLTYEIEPNGNARTVKFLGLIALFILAIAFINYVNMTTARSLERAKEVGLRKVIGAKRGQLIGQFLFEGLLLNGVALLLAFTALQPLLTVFGNFIDRPLANQPFDLVFWLSIGGLFIVGLLASCGYPSLVLTQFAPLETLRGSKIPTNEWSGKNALRKVLVIFQFGCSSALIFGLFVVGKQLNFLQKHDMGLSLDQIVSIKTPSNNDSLSLARMNAYKNEIAQISGIQSIAASNIVPSLGISTIAGTSSGLVLANKPNEVFSGTAYFLYTEPSFYETFNIQFLAGKPYIPTDERSTFQHVIINQAMMNLLGLSSPEAAIGEEIAYSGSTDGYKMKIEAVVDNFHIETLKEPARPTLYFATSRIGSGYISMKLEGKRAKNVLGSLEQTWKKVFPESPFEYWFLSDHFTNQYKAETQLTKVFGLFSSLAIFIACLGLFGMATYAASQRTKEIGVRKVLGATVTEITGLLTKDFLKPVALGVIIAAPLGYYFMENWLQDFAYRIDIHWSMFLLAGIATLGIAFLTVGFQSVKAALANPIKSLRSE